MHWRIHHEELSIIMENGTGLVANGAMSAAFKALKAGSTPAEAAIIAGTSEKAVLRMLGKVRKQLKAEGGDPSKTPFLARQSRTPKERVSATDFLASL
jgi:hypothetical protein